MQTNLILTLFFLSLTIGSISVGKDGVIPISCDTNSMFPTLDCNSHLKAKFLTSQERTNLSIGDIVLYSPTTSQRFRAKQNNFHVTATYILHRIINITENNYKIKGDNNNFIDNDFFGVIKPFQVSYKVFL